MCESKPDPYAVLRYANYRYFVLGRGFFSLAMQMQTVAVSWEIYQRLHMNTARRRAGARLHRAGRRCMPMVLFALPGGQAADRYDRKTIMR